MVPSRHKAKSIPAYIARFPEPTRARLKKLYTAVKKAAPGAEEGISYGMPAFKKGKGRVYFAAFKAHIGFFPGGYISDVFKKELKAYKTGKGSVQFPNDRPLPLGLITRMVKRRISQKKPSS
jgi:uncharacterized protein YdhG (YjbR/CyaY superfamily)